jgi:hypothetical protein
MNTSSGSSMVDLSSEETAVLAEGGQRLWVYIKKSLDHHMDNVKVKRKMDATDKSASLKEGKKDLIVVDTSRDILPDIEKLRFVITV